MGDCCGDNRFVLIERAKKDFIENTNLSDAELAVLDRMCFRMWQMGLLEKYEESPEKKAIDIERACEMAWQCLLPSTPKDVADARMEKFRKALEQA